VSSNSAAAPDPATTLDVTFTSSMGRVIRDYLRPE
jgi:hypothetical protein